MTDPNRHTGRPRPLRGWLRERDGRLAQLGEQARRTARLQRALQRLLPAELEGRWRLARLDETELGVVADSPAWATQLRYRQAELLAAAAEVIGHRPARCRIVMDPPRLRPGREESPRRLSRAGAESLRACAAGVEDERLREALLRLASRARD